MTAEKLDAGMGLDLRRARRMRDNRGIEPFRGFRLVSQRMKVAGTHRRARALFTDSRKALLIAGLLSRPVHPAHAAMLAFSAAATGGMLCLRIDSNERRNQRPTEEHHQRYGDGAAHCFAESIASAGFGEIIPSMYVLDTQCAGLSAARGGGSR
jgi:hypothetical protein